LDGLQGFAKIEEAKICVASAEEALEIRTMASAMKGILPVPEVDIIIDPEANEETPEWVTELKKEQKMKQVIEFSNVGVKEVWIIPMDVTGQIKWKKRETTVIQMAKEEEKEEIVLRIKIVEKFTPIEDFLKWNT